MIVLPGGVQGNDLVRNLAVAHNAIWGFDKAEIIDPRVCGQGNDQADIRPFRRFDGANAPVVGSVHVAHFEAGPFAGEAAGAKGGKAALVRYFRKRIGLVHELGKLRSSEKLLENRGHRLGIDQVMRHERGNFLQAHPLLDCPFHAHKADAVLVFHQFANQAHAAVAKMIDVVGRPVAVLEIHQDLDGRQNILVCQNAGFLVFLQVKALVELVAANWREIVIIRIAEEVVEKTGRYLWSWRRRRAQAAINFFLGLFLVGNAILDQGVANGRRCIRAHGVQHGKMPDAGLRHFFEQGRGYFVRGLRQHIAFGLLPGCGKIAVFIGAFLLELVELLFIRGKLANDVLSQEHAFHKLRTNLDCRYAGLADLSPGTLVDLLASLDKHGAIRRDYIGIGGILAVEILAHFPHQPAVFLENVIFASIEVVENLFLGHAHGLEQDGGRHLAAPVNAHIKDILVVKIKIQPRTAHGDDAAGIKHLARSVGLAAVMLKNDARGTLQLVDNDTLRAIDDERAFFGHQGQCSKIDVLLLDVPDGTGSGILVSIINNQAHFDAHGRLIGQALGNALRLIVLGLLDLVVYKFQAGRLVEILNGKYCMENPFKTFFLVALLVGHAFLKKLAVGINLQIKQMGNWVGCLDFAELLRKLAHGHLNRWLLKPPEAGWLTAPKNGSLLISRGNSRMKF